MNSPPKIIIASHERAGEILRGPLNDLRSVVSIGSPGDPLPKGYKSFPYRKIRLEFDDLVEPVSQLSGYLLATREDIAHLISFLHKVLPGSTTLIHCAMGISRSSACAAIFMAMATGPGHEMQALDLTSETKRTINPNKHILNLGDSLLGRNGRLIRASFKKWPEAGYEYLFLRAS